MFSGRTSNLSADIEHAPASLAAHPDQLAETLGGAAALATGGIGLAGGLGGVADLFSTAGTAIGDTASGVGSSVSNALGFGGGTGTDLATGATDAASLGTSPTGAAYGVPDASGVTLQDPATFTYTGDTPTPIASPATAGDPGNVPLPQPRPDIPGGSFGGSSDPTAASSTTYTAPSGTDPFGSIGSYLKNNAGVLGLGAAGLGANLAAPLLAKLGLAGSIPNQAALTTIAGQAGSQGAANQAYANSLEAPITTGTLPAGAQAEVTQALNDSIAQIKSKYASLGLSGSTMEQEAVTNAQNQSQAQQFQIEQQMAQTGIQAGAQAATDLGLEGTIYNDLTSAQISQDKNLQDAIAAFTGAVGGGVGRGLATNAVK